MAKTEKFHEKTQPDCMAVKLPCDVNIRFPGDLEYIPAIRKFVAELLQVSNFSQRFAYRSEIIIDEVCNNAVAFGCHSDNAEIEVSTHICNDHIEFTIKDQGGSKEHVSRLKKMMKTGPAEKDGASQKLGLEIVRTLSERMDVVIDENNLTSIHIVRKRENECKNA